MGEQRLTDMEEGREREVGGRVKRRGERDRGRAMGKERERVVTGF